MSDDVDSDTLSQFPHILLVDDDARLRRLTREYVEDAGFWVSEAQDAADAREKLTIYHYDAMLLDVMMPGESGIEFLQSYAGALPPVILLTAQGEADDRVIGLELGARDYIVKPFEPRELVLRIRNIVRGAKRAASADALDVAQTQAPQDKQSWEFMGFRFDAAQQRIYYGDDFCVLSASERAMLLALLHKRGHAVSRAELLEASRDPDDVSDGENSERAIDVAITRLRKKCEQLASDVTVIHTVRGKGYIMYGDV